MIDFICEVLGYELQSTNYQNIDQYVYYGSVMCTFVLFVLVVFLLMRFLQWLWGAWK